MGVPAPRARYPLKGFVTGPSLLVNRLSRNQVSQKIPIAPPPSPSSRHEFGNDSNSMSRVQYEPIMRQLRDIGIRG